MSECRWSHQYYNSLYHLRSCPCMWKSWPMNHCGWSTFNSNILYKVLAYLKKCSSTFILLYRCFNWKCLQSQLETPHEELYFKKQLTVSEAMMQPFTSFRITSLCISFTEIMGLLQWCCDYVLCDSDMLYLLTFLVTPNQINLIHPKKNSLS